jgi:hypothetical protein
MDSFLLQGHNATQQNFSGRNLQIPDETYTLVDAAHF